MVIEMGEWREEGDWKIFVYGLSFVIWKVQFKFQVSVKVNRNVKMTNVESVDTVLQYLSYLQLLITEITGHKNTMKMTKGQVKFTIQMVGQRKKIVRLVKK